MVQGCGAIQSVLREGGSLTHSVVGAERGGSAIPLRNGCRPRKGLAVAILAVFGAGFLVNPVPLVQRLGHLYRLRLAIAAFKVLGNPKEDLIGYLAVRDAPASAV